MTDGDDDPRADSDEEIDDDIDTDGEEEDVAAAPMGTPGLTDVATDKARIEGGENGEQDSRKDSTAQGLQTLEASSRVEVDSDGDNKMANAHPRGSGDDGKGDMQRGEFGKTAPEEENRVPQAQGSSLFKKDTRLSSKFKIQGDGEEEDDDEDDNEEEEEEEKVEELTPEELKKQKELEYHRRLIQSMTPQQRNRYEAYRKARFKKGQVKNIMQDGNPYDKFSVKDEVAAFMAGVAKVFVGDLVEEALDVAKLDQISHEPLAPRHIREAYRRLQLRGKLARPRFGRPRKLLRR